MLRDIINTGKWISITFVKANGEVSKVAGRVGVKKYLRGGSNTVAHKKEYVTVYDLKRGYRNVNINNIMMIKANNKTYDLRG